MTLATGVAPQPIIFRDLSFGKELAHGQVRAQVVGADFGLGQRDLVEGALEFVIMNPRLREAAIQLRLQLHEPFSLLDGPGSHALEESFRLRPLLRGEGELVGEIEHMARTRVVVQLRHLREAHPLAVQVAPDLGLREGLDTPRLLAGIGLRWLVLVLRREGGGGSEEESEYH
jgi:hypothetical protein